MHTILFFSAIMVLLSTSIRAQDPNQYCPAATAEPDCSSCTLPCKYVTDPKDCTQYFECLTQSSAVGPIKCPSGTFFYPTAGAAGEGTPCYEFNFCTQLCQCTQSCEFSGQVYADLQDCNKYYECICPGSDVACYSQGQSCNPGEIFNGAACKDTSEDLCCFG